MLQPYLNPALHRAAAAEAHSTLEYRGPHRLRDDDCLMLQPPRSASRRPTRSSPGGRPADFRCRTTAHPGAIPARKNGRKQANSTLTSPARRRALGFAQRLLQDEVEDHADANGEHEGHHGRGGCAPAASRARCQRRCQRRWPWRWTPCGQRGCAAAMAPSSPTSGASASANGSPAATAKATDRPISTPSTRLPTSTVMTGSPRPPGPALATQQ